MRQLGGIHRLEPQARILHWWPGSLYKSKLHNLFKQMILEGSMSVYFDEMLQGTPSQILSRLARKIGAHARHGAHHQKVGITNNPQRRWSTGYASKGWHRMSVIYVSRSHKNVCQLEDILIQRFRSGLSSTKGYFYNLRGGGGGRPPRTGPYYLYLVNAPKHSRIR
jgi:hypothetical protein